MARPDLTPLLTTLCADTIRELNQALTRGTTLLLSRIGDAPNETIAHCQPEAILIDAVLFPQRDQVRLELLRATVGRLLAGPPALLADAGPRGDTARLTLSETYGRNTATVLTLLENHGPASNPMRMSVADILAGLPAATAIVVYDAHLLDTEARWDLRETGRPLLLVTRPDHASGLTGADAPFYGQAKTVQLKAPSVREWAHALDVCRQPMHPSDLEWLLTRTRGRVGTTIRALEMMLPNRSPRTAWHIAVRDSRQRAHDTLLLARDLHKYAPALLLAIAQNQKPYAAIPDAKSRPAQIALPLRKLHALDIIEQPAPREWQIADPLLQHALLSLLNATRARELARELFDEVSAQPA